MNDQKSRLNPPPETPRDIRLGLTKAEDVAFPLRWGLIGAGNICRQWAEALKACEGATLSAVASRSKENARDFARQHGIDKFYNDYAELVNSADVDVVYVGTPDRLHKEHCLLALNAGKHVLCEKDIAQTVADAQEMYEAAKKITSCYRTVSGHASFLRWNTRECYLSRALSATL